MQEQDSMMSAWVYNKKPKDKKKKKKADLLKGRCASKTKMCHSHLFFVKDLYTLGVFPDIGDECLIDLVPFAAGYAEDEVV